MLTVEITWSKDESKIDFTTWSRQTKTFESEEKALEWCRKNANHIVQINDSPMFFGETISHFAIMNALRGGAR